MSFEAQPHQGGRDPSLYRPNVGLALFSKQGHVWLGRRAGVRKDDVRYAWQMPQGGIDRGETPSQAALRELGEETGLEPDQVELLEEYEPWLFYDFPPALKAKLTGPYYGQRQKWFAYRFTGSDTRKRRNKPSSSASPRLRSSPPPTGCLERSTGTSKGML